MTARVSEVPPPAETAPSYSAAYAWAAVGLITLISVSSFIDRTIMGMLVKPIRADLHITDTQFSYLTGLAFAITYTASGIPFGWASDRLSRRAIISMGCGAWSVMTAACGFASNFATLFLCRVGVGLGEGSLQPCAYPMIASYFRAGTARAMSVYNMAHPIGAGLAMIIAGSLIGALLTTSSIDVPLIGAMRSWQVVFLTVGLAGVPLALLAAIVLRDPSRRTAQSRADQASVAAVCAFMWRERKAYATLIVSLGCVSIISSGGTAWFPAFLMRVHGFSPVNAGLFIGLSGAIGGIVGNFVVGSITDRLMARGQKDIATLVLIPVALAAFVCVVIGPIVPVRWLSLLLFGGAGLFTLTATGVYHVIRLAVTPQPVWGQSTAIYGIFTNLIGLVVGPTAIALCTDHVFHDDNAVNYSISLVFGVSIAVLVITLLLGRKVLLRRIGNPAPL